MGHLERSFPPLITRLDETQDGILFSPSTERCDHDVTGTEYATDSGSFAFLMTTNEWKPSLSPHEWSDSAESSVQLG